MFILLGIFFYTGTILWTSLPLSIRQSQSRVFKGQVRAHLQGKVTNQNMTGRSQVFYCVCVFVTIRFNNCELVQCLYCLYFSASSGLANAFSTSRLVRKGSLQDRFLKFISLYLVFCLFLICWMSSFSVAYCFGDFCVYYVLVCPVFVFYDIRGHAGNTCLHFTCYILFFVFYIHKFIQSLRQMT